jgi:hypothetical protein
VLVAFAEAVTLVTDRSISFMPRVEVGRGTGLAGAQPASRPTCIRPRALSATRAHACFAVCTQSTGVAHD